MSNSTSHMGQFLQDGKNDQTLSKKKYFLPLHCDQTVRLFQLFSTVLKRFRPVHLKNSLVLVLAQFFDQMVRQIIIIIFQTSNSCNLGSR